MKRSCLKMKNGRQLLFFAKNNKVVGLGFFPNPTTL